VELATFDEKGSHKVHPTLAAGEALSKISADASVPLLIEALKEPRKRFWAAQILGGLGDTATEAIPELVEAVREVATAVTDDERNASAQAANALANIRPKGLSALISEMGHDHPEVRCLAIQFVPDGSDGKPAVEALARRLADTQDDVRRLAAIALKDIGPDAEAAILFLEIARKKERKGFVLFSIENALKSIQGKRPD